MKTAKDGFHYDEASHQWVADESAKPAAVPDKPAAAPTKPAADTKE